MGGAASGALASSIATETIISELHRWWHKVPKRTPDSIEAALRRIEENTYGTCTACGKITSVAALMSPGFSIGQPLPLGYDTYNVPYSYRETYYDTPNAMYRYNNGYIYQVDPVSRLVTAIVASLLT